MARLKSGKGKLVRRFGVNIFGNPKYDRLLSRKKTQQRSRGRATEYGKQLMEKQKLKFSYGISEKQFYNIFQKAKKMKGVTGHNMLILLETRLDNVVYTLKFASTRAQSRQMVSHGHFLFNGRKVTIPSITVKVGDIIKVKEKESSKTFVRNNLAKNTHRIISPWLLLDEDKLEGKVNSMPTRDMITTMAEEQAIVEFYSK